MAGVLDFLNTDDGRLGLSLLAAAGPSMAPVGIGQRLQAGMAGFDDYKKDQARAKLTDIQYQGGLLGLMRAQREADTEQKLADAAQQSTGPNGFDLAGYAGRLMPIDPMKGVAFQAAIQKDETPITVAPGASLVNRKTLQPVFTAPKEAETPAAVREYEYALKQGYKGSFTDWQLAQKKAGASNISVNTEKSLLNDIAGGLGKSLVGARDGAQSALGTIGTVNRLMDALDTNKVMAGPGTTFRQYGLQVGNLLGVSGKDAQEKLLNTRQAIQSLAQLELDGAQQMKGQGQITEAERSIIKRAASGDVDSMTTSELRLLGGVLDRAARSKIQNYNKQVKPLAANPNAAPLAPFLNVEEPPARATSGGVRRFNPATGRIE